MSMDSYFEDLFSSLDNMDAALAGVIGVVIVMVIIFALIAFAFAVIAYVLNGISLSAIAKRRNIRNSWLAWVPIGSSWLIGCIADQYQYVVHGKTTKRRTFILWLSVASYLLVLGDLPFEILGMIVPELLIVLTVLSFLSVVLTWAVSIAWSIFTCIALYDLFRSCNPKNAVLYLVLSIVFSITQPIFLFVNRNKDLGMQPLKQEPADAVITAEAAEQEISETIPELPQPEETDAE